MLAPSARDEPDLGTPLVAGCVERGANGAYRRDEHELELVTPAAVESSASGPLSASGDRQGSAEP